MTPMTALRTVDMHSNATRLLPKPMLPSVAKITRMIIRRPKRAITWVDRSCCDKFGNCAKISNSDGGSFAVLREIVGQERIIKCARLARYDGDTCPARRRSDPLGLDEGAQDRQRQIGMVGFDRLIQPFGKLALA